MITDPGDAMNGGVDFNFGLKKNIEIHEHITRRSHDLHLPKVSTNWRKQMFKFSALKVHMTRKFFLRFSVVQYL